MLQLTKQNCREKQSLKTAKGLLDESIRTRCRHDVSVHLNYMKIPREWARSPPVDTFYTNTWFYLYKPDCTICETTSRI